MRKCNGIQLDPCQMHLGVSMLLLWLCTTTFGGWFNTTWPYRRPVELIWEDDRPTGDEVAMIDFYTGGHHKPKGEDVRLATADGTLVASRVIMTGPGDHLRVLFAPAKGERNYFVYFGHTKPDPLPAKLRDWSPSRGLMIETKLYGGGAVGNHEQLAQTFDRATNFLGCTMIDRPFLGLNLFGEQQTTISRISGSLSIADEGEHVVALAADDVGSLYIDGKPVLYVRGGPHDSRHNKKISLKPGSHPFLLYHVNVGGPGFFSVAWKTPDTKSFEVIPRESFGNVIRGTVGPLEIHEKLLVADFTCGNQAEAYFADRYTHRYNFKANLPKTSAPAKFEWDFGDGQAATGEKVEHVYLNDGVYPVRLTASIGRNSDTITHRIQVSRNFEKLNNPATDAVSQHSKLVQTYELEKLSPAALAAATWLHVRAEQLDAALQAAEHLSSVRSHPNAGDVQNLHRELSRAALNAGKIDPLIDVLQKVPNESNLRPTHWRLLGQSLLWWKADFDQATKTLKDREDGQCKRMYGQALVLAGKLDEGRKVLESLPTEESLEKQLAISGAMARTTEFFISEGDAESGEDAWERWQQRYPADFLDGYSMLLRVRLIELRKQPQVAARVAEACALAVPNSSYSPSLLDKASKLLEQIDARKSGALRELLKSKYPEDPLSNK